MNNAKLSSQKITKFFFVIFQISIYKDNETIIIAVALSSFGRIPTGDEKEEGVKWQICSYEVLI